MCHMTHVRETHLRNLYVCHTDLQQDISTVAYISLQLSMIVELVTLLQQRIPETN